MMWSDPIVEEVRRARDAYAARFNYDLRAIFQDIKEQEKKSGRTFITVVPPALMPNSSAPPLRPRFRLPHVQRRSRRFR